MEGEQKSLPAEAMLKQVLYISQPPSPAAPGPVQRAITPALCHYPCIVPPPGIEPPSPELGQSRGVPPAPATRWLVPCQHQELPSPAPSVPARPTALMCQPRSSPRSQTIPTPTQQISAFPRWRKLQARSLLANGNKNTAPACSIKKNK